MKLSGVWIFPLLYLLGFVDGSELPSGWTAHPWQGKTYYYNQQTGVSQWHRPGAPNPINTSPSHPSAELRSTQATSPPATPEIERLRSELARILSERDSVLKTSQESLQLHQKLESRLNATSHERQALQSRLDESTQENRQLQLRLNDAKEQLAAAQGRITHLADTVAGLRRLMRDADANVSVIEAQLDQSLARIDQQDRELAEAYKEIERLDERLRELARMRARNTLPSFLPRMLRRWLPFRPTRTLRTATLIDEIEARLNRTILTLRKNNTGLAEALDAKTKELNAMVIRVSESSQQATQASKAHAALRDHMDMLVSKLSEKEKQNSEQEAVNAALQTELNELRNAENTQLQADRTKLLDEHQAMASQCVELQHVIQDKDRTIEALNSTAATLQQSLIHLRQQLATATSELHQLRQSGDATSSTKKRKSWCFLGLM